MSGTEVTARDLTTGESEKVTIRDNHVVIVDGKAYISHITAYANGTHIITIKRAETIEDAQAATPTIARHFGRVSA